MATHEPKNEFMGESGGRFSMPGFGPFKNVEAKDEAVGNFINPKLTFEPEKEVKGGRVNYYLVRIQHPQREDQPPYTAECEDIGEALELTPDEMNIFKEIWRSANARKGNGKPDHKALYGAQKIVHYAGRILKRLSR